MCPTDKFEEKPYLWICVEKSDLFSIIGQLHIRLKRDFLQIICLCEVRIRLAGSTHAVMTFSQISGFNLLLLQLLFIEKKRAQSALSGTKQLLSKGINTYTIAAGVRIKHLLDISKLEVGIHLEPT